MTDSNMRIFVIYNGRVSIGEPGVDWTPLQYMIKLGIVTDDHDPVYEDVIRGHILNGHVTCFMGHKFMLPKLDATLEKLLIVVQQKCGLPEDTIFYFGVNKGQPGTPWYAPNSQHRLEYVKWSIKLASKSTA